MYRKCPYLVAALAASFLISPFRPLPMAGASYIDAQPAYIRAYVELCHIDNWGENCWSDADIYPTIPLPYREARGYTVKIGIDSNQPPTENTGPIPPDMTPHTIHLVVMGARYQMGAGSQALLYSVIHTWEGHIYGDMSWPLTKLISFPTGGSKPLGWVQPNLFSFMISVDGWPSPAGSVVYVTP